MLHRNAASGGMDAAQQANLLNLLQRQQLQMGNLSVANHANNSVGAAMAMMATLQQQQQGGASGGGGGTASHRNSMTGVPGATTVGSSFNMGGATDMNTFMMNMNYMGGVGGTHPPTATVALNSSNHSNNNNEKQGPLLLIPPKKSKNKHKQTFSMKLMNILSLRECHSSIRWMPNGRSFCIVDSKILVEKVLPVYFKEAKYTSFTRKLNRWGFKHYSLPINSAGGGSSATAEKEMSIYSHDKFRRDDPELCETMDGGHRRRNARKDEERTRQFYSQLKPEVRDLLRQGQGVGVSAGEEGASVVGVINNFHYKLKPLQSRQEQEEHHPLVKTLLDSRLSCSKCKRCNCNCCNNNSRCTATATTTGESNDGHVILHVEQCCFNVCRRK
ncbi:heat shock factor family protein [Skeletonema marinoi]|uniref:Heat shock factor family protein n=1 Tax=Skeletonema marinoi TaxID=267567 RepID=A0AAD8Y1U5_9STRA|nr:heat shock factor family protein [Skeletonema marinoi]